MTLKTSSLPPSRVHCEGGEPPNQALKLTGAAFSSFARRQVFAGGPGSLA